MRAFKIDPETRTVSEFNPNGNKDINEAIGFSIMYEIKNIQINATPLDLVSDMMSSNKKPGFIFDGAIYHGNAVIVQNATLPKPAPVPAEIMPADVLPGITWI